MEGIMQVQNQLETGFQANNTALHEVDEDDELSEPDTVTELPRFTPQPRRHHRLPGSSHVLKVASVASSMNIDDDPVPDPESPDNQTHTLWPLSPSKKSSKQVKYRRRYSHNKMSEKLKPQEGPGVTAMHSDMMLRNPMLVRPSKTTTKATPTTTITAAPSDFAPQNARQKMIVHLQDAPYTTTSGDAIGGLPIACAEDNPEQQADVLIENQRGWFFLGFPFFSANMLFPSDPAAWTCGPTGLTHAPGDISTFALPTPDWEWSWRRWYVDMAYDVDDQGWSYSLYFSSKTWHGSHVWFHSFVRRRRWIRVRQKKKISTTVPITNAVAENEDYLNYARSSFEAAHYGPKYFVLPPAGRIESSLASEAPASIRKNSMESSNSLQVNPQYLQLLHQMRAGNTPAASLRRLSQFSDRASINSFFGEHRDFAALLTELQGARLDRERLDLLTSFVAAAGLHADDHSTPQQEATLSELQTITSDPHYIRAILQTFTFLDSKRHLISHLKGVLDQFTNQQPMPSHEAHYSEDEDNQPSEGSSNSSSTVKPLDEKTVSTTAQTSHDAFTKVLKSMISICSDVVKQQQYYTDQLRLH